jgi:hypothetical protein
VCLFICNAIPAGAKLTALRTAALALLLALAACAPVFAQQQVYSYQNITTDTTTTLKTGPGYLHTVCINTPAATGTITIYDNTAASGTKIGTITSYASTAVRQHYDVAFWIGLTIVTATAAPDITVTFR